MAKYTQELIKNKQIWERFVLKQNPGSFLQSWAWGETNKKIGAKIFRVGFKKDGKIVGVCLLIKESAKRGPHLIIPGGPLIDWQNKALVAFFIKTIKSLSINEKVWFIRVRPELREDEKSRNLFRKLGFVRAPMHLHAQNTWILEIAKPEDEILAGMRKSTRYLIKKSLKSNLRLRVSKDSNSSSVLFALQKQTAKRHGFIGFPKKTF